MIECGWRRSRLDPCVYYVVDKSSSWFWKGGVGYVTEPMLKEHMPAPSKDSMVYVCGPPPMYKAPFVLLKISSTVASLAS